MATPKTRRGARRRRGPIAKMAPPTGSLAQALIDIRALLDLLEVDYALVGGLAVSARAEPRTTRDVDLAISVPGDEDAERIIHALQSRGYAVVTLVEQTNTARLATARLRKVKGAAVIVDLLFASSGIESEIVRQATTLELLPALSLRVACVGHLLAMKVLARDDRTRPQDYDDIRALLAVAKKKDRSLAEKSLKLIQSRGFARDRPLRTLWKQALRELG